jgi:hypothetical protein
MLSRRNIALAAAAGACVLAGALWYWFTARPIGDAKAMIACLPQSAATLAFLDVDGMRRSGVLDMIAGSKAAEDPEYKKFIAATGFDYRRDLKRVAASFSGNDTFFLLSGAFDWGKLNAYAISQGGVCRDTVCRVRGSQPGRWVSFYPLRSNALAIAFSANEYAALDIAERKAAGPAAAAPDAPVWVWVPGAVLENAKLPAGTRSFTSPLATAERIVFSLGAKDSGLEMNLDVTCSSPAAASDLLVKLEGATNMLRKLIEREHLKPNANDLSGLLTSGAFRREDRKVYGMWPLRREFLESVASGAVN